MDLLNYICFCFFKKKPTKNQSPLLAYVLEKTDDDRTRDGEHENSPQAADKQVDKASNSKDQNANNKLEFSSPNNINSGEHNRYGSMVNPIILEHNDKQHTFDHSLMNTPQQKTPQKTPASQFSNGSQFSLADTPQKTITPQRI